MAILKKFEMQFLRFAEFSFENQKNGFVSPFSWSSNTDHDTLGNYLDALLFPYDLMISSRSLSSIGQSSHRYSPQRTEYPPSGRTICFPHFPQWVGWKGGGLFSVVKLCSLVPYQTYISISCLKLDMHFLHACHSPVCSSQAWCPQSVNRLWFLEQLFLA